MVVIIEAMLNMHEKKRKVPFTLSRLSVLVIDESAIFVVTWYIMLEHGKQNQLDRRNHTCREANRAYHGVRGQLRELSQASLW